jgi:polyisoprenyl-teichoic acid--peptidoglycan teichoic acid transferase
VKRRRPIGSVLMIVVGLLFTVASGLTYFGVDKAVKTISDAIPTAHLGIQTVPGSSINGVLNILLIGVDTRPNNTIGSRSDSIIILHIPASHDRGYLISIPRDTLAGIAGHGRGKINSAFQWGSMHNGGYAGGSQELLTTLKQDYDLTFDAALVINFSGFEDIVTALGGVTMDIDETATSIHHGYEISDPSVHKKPFILGGPDSLPIHGLNHPLPGVLPVIYHKGPNQHLSAYEALDYVRIRDYLPNGDYDRQRHQQQFIKAVMEEAIQKGLSNPLKAGTFLDSISKAFLLDPGSHAMSDWIFTLKGISPSSIATIQTNDGKFNSERVNGTDYEALSPTSLELLKDVRTDNLAAFIDQNPTWLTSS